jgi:hypothetical protein
MIKTGRSEEKMKTNQNIPEMTGMKAKLSTLWVFAVFNYLYADVIGLMKSENLQAFLSGMAGSMQITDGFLLGAAILMETAIALVLLCRFLQYRANRWANILVGALHTVTVLASMFVGTGPGLYYVFFGTIEIACTAFIVWSAWRWPNPESGALHGESIPQFMEAPGVLTE